MSMPFASAGKNSRVFTARFPGICEDCQEGFEEGEEVMYADSDLVHAECIDVPARPAQKVCTNCYLVHAGECF